MLGFRREDYGKRGGFFGYTWVGLFEDTENALIVGE